MSETLLASLLIRFGFNLTEVILKNINGVTTVEDAVARLSAIKSAQAYVDADAAERGVTSIPLPPV